MLGEYLSEKQIYENRNRKGTLLVYRFNPSMFEHRQILFVGSLVMHGRNRMIAE
jgi:hypothetical protein